MKTKLLVFSAFVLTAGVVVGYPLTHGAPARPSAVPKATALVAPAERPKVEVVFVLDTTSSMSGLIDAAKENIWSIATTLAQATPTPEVRMGLVAFRDRGDQYVTQVVPLSSDLDSMYATLMGFRAEGGGDGPESVNQALHDAVNRIAWSNDPRSYKVIFLVGDAPPHMDYPDDPKYPDTVKSAIAKGIVVNTVLAGADPGTRTEWQRIADLNQGTFLQVEQSGSAVAVVTPYDGKIAELSRELDETRLFYGDAATQRDLAGKVEATRKLHDEGSLAARAKRAAFNSSAAGEANLLGSNDLVDAVGSGRVKLAELDASQLPEDLRKLDAEQRAQRIEEKANDRAKLKAGIAELDLQRRDYIAADLKKRGVGADSLDQKIFDTVQAQAAPKGFRYDGAAAH